MLGAYVGEAIPEIEPGQVTMERPAGRPLTWSAEKLPAGNFLDFSFLQARGGPRGFQQASQAMRPERPEAKVAGRQLGRSLFIMALSASCASPKLTGRLFLAFNDDFVDEGQGKRVSSCIRILSDKARHEVVIITKHGRGSLVVMVGASQAARQECRSTVELTKERMEAVRTARGSEEFAHVDAELK